MTKERIVYFDILRVISCFLVIMVHVSSNPISTASPSTFDYQIGNFYNTLAISAPAIFIMLSGAIFLRPEYWKMPLKKLWKKYILRLIVSFAFWSCLYTLIIWIPYYSFTIDTVKLYFLEVITAPPMYHLWFIPMLISIYMILPVLGPAFNDKRNCKYYLALFILLQLLIPTILNFDFEHKAILQGLYGKIPYLLFVGHVGYFILGYYLSIENSSKKLRSILYVLGALGLLLAVGIDGYLSIQQDTSVRFLDDIFSINIFLFASAVFVAFRHIPWKTNKFTNIVSTLSKLTFGIYLIHVLIMDKVFETCTSLCTLPAIIWIPVITTITFVISTAIIWIVYKIPVINKYII